MTDQIDPNDVRFFSGRSNQPIAEKIATHLKLPLDETKFSRFSNDNLYVQLGKSVRGRIVYIVQSLTPPVSDHLVELLMMLDIAKSAAAREVHAIVPYFSYARSDKKDAPRISITARLIADLLKTSGATHFMSMTLHSPQVHGFFSIPADPLTARMELAAYIRQRELNPERDVVVAPIASADKTRVSDTKVKIGGLIGRQVRGFKRAFVYDDEIATAGSVVELSQVLVDSGINEIILVCTHGLFLGPAVERIHSIPEISEVVTTDTVERPSARQPHNLSVLSVSTVFAEAIRQNYCHRSIGELFEGVEG